MHCTICKEPMIVLELDQIEIDHCLECGGIWLDSGELESLLDEPSKAKEIMEHPAEAARDSKSDKKCPICMAPMREMAVGERSPVHIDRCPNNHGLWFDRGELEDILAILNTGRDSRVAKLLKMMFREQAE